MLLAEERSHVYKTNNKRICQWYFSNVIPLSSAELEATNAYNYIKQLQKVTEKNLYTPEERTAIENHAVENSSTHLVKYFSRKLKIHISESARRVVYSYLKNQLQISNHAAVGSSTT